MSRGDGHTVSGGGYRPGLERDLDSVPGAVGVNNHMGSAATADPRLMRVVARVLARRGLFFVDSRGAARVLWKLRNEPWRPTHRLMEDDSAPAGAPVGASHYRFAKTLEAFVGGNDADGNGPEFRRDHAVKKYLSTKYLSTC